jgi:D-methionine transport system ATP-binding protein
LRGKHAGRIVSARVHDDGRLGAVLSDAVGRHGVRFEIVFGGISALQGRSFGSLTLELLGEPAAVDALIADLRTVTEVEEVAA